jgi:hypothetical protein
LVQTATLAFVAMVFGVVGGAEPADGEGLAVIVVVTLRVGIAADLAR